MRHRPGLLAWRLIALSLVAGCADRPDEPSLQSDVDRVCGEVAKIRGSAFASKVEAQAQPEAEFRKFILRQIEKDYPGRSLETKGRALALLGLLPDGIDLRETLTKLTMGQAAAYYDPEKHRFYLVKEGLPRELRLFTYAHELQHALQDQRFHLEAFVDATKLSDDEELARRCLVEGEANLVSVLYLYSQAGREVAPDAEDEIGRRIDSQYETLRRNDFLLGDQKEEMRAKLGDAAKDLERRDREAAEVPRYLRQILSDPYYVGALFVQKAYRAGGWKAVDALYKDPPRSSEQVLHPEKLFGKERDEPRAVALPGAEGAEDEDTLGEAGIEFLLEDGLRAAGKDRAAARQQAEKAASGWGGDRYILGKEGRLVWLAVWDTEGDAAEFEEALEQVLAARLRASLGAVDASGGRAFDARDGRLSAYVAKSKDRVALAIGPRGAALGAAAAEALRTAAVSPAPKK